MSTFLKPDTNRIAGLSPLRLKKRSLAGHPEVDATVSNAFLLHGYSNLQTSYQNLLLYMPLILLDHSYFHLKLYKQVFQPKEREKQHVNRALKLYRTYFSILLASKNDDVMRLLDDMDEMQCRFTLQYTLLQYALQNNNFHRRALTDDQSRKYGYLISIITELVHAGHLANSIGLMIDKGLKGILDYIEGPLFSCVIPNYERLQKEDSDLCNATIRKVNDIIAVRLDELKEQNKEE